MSVLERFQGQWQFSRGRTLGLLDTISNLPNPQQVLGYRPGPGRAHIAWQLMHIGITEELFATERLGNSPAGFTDLVPRFKGGSTPDDQFPDLETIRKVLTESREHLLATVGKISEPDLSKIPEVFKERGWTLETALYVIGWHEAHHQGQAHLTLNLYKAAHGL